MTSRRVQSQAGTSLADVYDVQGSIAGIDALDIEDIKGVHELGAQIQSERLLTSITRANTGAIIQNTAFELVTGAFNDAAVRIFALTVLGTVIARTAHLSVAIRDVDSDREIPVFVWDSSSSVEQPLQWSDDGAAAGLVSYFAPLVTHFPTLLTRTGVAKGLGEFVLRGLTSGFGAGSVTLIMMLHIARPTLSEGVPPAGEPSSHGLPIPSW